MIISEAEYKTLETLAHRNLALGNKVFYVPLLDGGQLEVHVSSQADLRLWAEDLLKEYPDTHPYGATTQFGWER